MNSVTCTCSWREQQKQERRCDAMQVNSKIPITLELGSNDQPHHLARVLSLATDHIGQDDTPDPLS